MFDQGTCTLCGICLVECPCTEISARKLLPAIGAEVVEMKHNRQESYCCRAKDPTFSEKYDSVKVSEAEEQGADAIAVACAGCMRISKKKPLNGISEPST